MSVAETIRSKLEAAFEPSALEIVDESHLHAGHAGNPGGGGESHFKVTIVADGFAGQNRVARQRAVYDVLRDELAGPVHALSVTARSPDEAPGEKN